MLKHLQMNTAKGFLKRAIGIAMFLFPFSLSAQLSFTLIPTHVTCKGSSNGSITTVINTGIPPFDFTWSTGAKTQTINGLQAGVYTVTVIDGQNNLVVNSILIMEPEQLSIKAASDTSVCEGTDLKLTAKAAGGIAPYSFVWLCDTSFCFLDDNSKAQPIAKLPLGKRKFYVQVQDANNCTGVVDSTEVTVLPIPALDKLQDISITRGESTVLSAIGSNIQSFQWEPENILDYFQAQNPVATVTETTRIFLTVKSKDGCIIKDSLLLTANIPNDIYNLFTPNGDGFNDYFVVSDPYLIKDCILTIYNRWGREVYKSKDYKNDWDGTFNGSPLPDGPYYYTISCGGNTQEVKGSVTILRSK
jgi:gliding motility-associated-like protein